MLLVSSLLPAPRFCSRRSRRIRSTTLSNLLGFGSGKSRSLRSVEGFTCFGPDHDLPHFGLNERNFAIWLRPMAVHRSKVLIAIEMS